MLQRSSISPAEREKYRPRSPPEISEHKKLKKEEKDGHVSKESILQGLLIIIIIKKMGVSLPLNIKLKWSVS